MNLYLQSPSGDEVNLTEFATGGTRVVDGYPRGLFDIASIDHVQYVDADGHPYLYNYRYRPLVVDLRLVVSSTTQSHLWQHISAILSTARMSKNPCRLKVVENNKMVFLDVHPESSSVVVNVATSEITLRLVSYGRWYKGTASNATLNVRETKLFKFLAIRKPGVGWETFDNGPSYMVYDIAVVDDTTFYIGGAFYIVNGVTVNGIVKWTGSAWQALGSGVGGLTQTVYALAIGTDGMLYVGGHFSTAGGVTVNSIAKWTGSTWQALGSGVGGLTQTVYALAIGADGMLYIGGNFTTAGGVTVNSVARWTGSTWQALGSGLSGTVNVLYVARDGTLYAGGNFSTPTGNCIAKWTGSEWQAVGGGISNAVYAITEGADGSLYVGGAFPTIGGLSVNFIARWDGVAWQKLGSGMNNYVKTLAASDDILYAGGLFSTAGGVSASRAALWNGFRWLPLDMQTVSSDVNKAVYRNSKLYLVSATNETMTCSAVNTVTVPDDVYPKLTFTCTANGSVRYIENETTRQRVWLNYDMIAGETLTLDFETATATSSTRGNVLWAVAAGSDMHLRLAAGTNTLWVFAPTGTFNAALEWNERYQNLAEALRD